MKRDYEIEARRLTTALFRVLQAAVMAGVCFGAAEGIHKIYAFIGVLLLRTIGATN